MARFLKYAGIVLAVLAGLLILAVVVINVIPGEKYKSLISSGVKSATGRELVIEGDFDIKLLSTLAIKASGVKFANAEWGSRPDMMSIDNIEGEVALFPLLKGILDVTLVVDNPDLLLEKDASGQENWQFGDQDEETEEKAETEKEAKSGGGLPIRPLIRKLHLNETRFVLLDGESGNNINVSSDKLHIGSIEGRLDIDINGKYNDIPLAFTGGVDNAEFFVDNQPADVKLDGNFGDAKLVITGTAGPVDPTFDLDVTTAVHTDSVAAFSPLAGRELPDIGPLAVSVKLNGKEGKYTVSDLLTTLDDDTVTAEIKGAIADLTAMNGMKMEAKVDTGKLTEILKAVGVQTEYALPDVFNATAVVEGDLKNLTLKQFETKIAGQGVNVKGTAEAKNIMTLEGVSADLKLETESLGLIENIAKTKLPALGPVKATINVVSKGENLGLMEVKADLDADQIRADVGGTIGDPLKLKDINADVSLGVDSFAWLADFLKVELPPLGPLNASARVASKGDTFEVNDIKIDLVDKNKKVQASIAASVKDVLKLAGIDADIKVGVKSLASLDPIVKAKLPASGPVTLETKISSKDGLDSPATIASVLKSDGIRADLTGSITDPLKALGIDLALKVEADSMQDVGKLSGVPFPAKDPLKLEAKFTAGEKTYELAKLTIHAGDLDVKGHAAYKKPAQSGGRPQLDGEFHISELDMRKLQKAKAKVAESKSKPKAEKKEDSAGKKKLFPSEPLPFDALQSTDVNLELTIKKLNTVQLTLNDVMANLSLDKGLLKLKPLKARIGAGTINGTAVVDARKKPAALDVDIRMKDATYRDFGGKLNFVADLKGRGNSIAGILAGLDGQIEFDVKEATLDKNFMTGFGAGLLDKLNPFGKNEKSTELNCAIVLFDIKNGLADANDKIALQMSDVTWFGSGEIDLKTEEIDFGVKSRSRKKLDIGLGTLAGLVHIGGTLAEPKVQLDPADVAVKYGKYLAFGATGGLSFAADLVWGKIKANTDVCAKILEGLEPDE